MKGIRFDKEKFELTLSKPWAFLFIAQTFFCAAALIEAIVLLF